MKCACFESARKKLQLGDFVHIYDKVSLLLQNKYMFCVRATLTEVYF